MNLSNLHAKISAIFPIDGISIDENNQYIFHSELEIPADKLIEMNELVVLWRLESEKVVKKQILDQKWSDRLSQGWETPSGWKLGLTVQEVSLLTGAFLLAKEASNIGVDAPVSIVDLSGQSHLISLSDFTGIMLAYGQARSELSGIYAEKARAIEDADTIEEVQMVNVTI
jgi:hypothetical protein